MNQDERLLLVNELIVTNKAFLSIDSDRTVRETLKKIHAKYSSNFELYFANGGDQNNDSIPETKTANKLGIKLLDGLGSKIQSSSWLLS